jgi:hypothetical protein
MIYEKNKILLYTLSPHRVDTSMERRNRLKFNARFTDIPQKKKAAFGDFLLC